MITKVLTCEHLPQEDIFNLDILYFDEMLFCLLYKRKIPMDTKILSTLNSQMLSFNDKINI